MPAKKIKVYRDSKRHARAPESANGIHLQIELPAMSEPTTDTYLDCLEVLNRVFLGALHQATPSSEQPATGSRLSGTLSPLTLFREATMLADARQLILQDGDWVTSAALSQLTGLEPAALAASLLTWLHDGRIISLNGRGQEYFPLFAFGGLLQQPPTAEFSAVVKVLSEKKDDWGMAFWFASSNHFLEGKRPKDLLQSTPERVRRAAEEEVAWQVNG